MKSIKTILIIFVFSGASIFSQNEIPNPSFEEWGAGNPTSWYSTNTSFTNNITQQSEAHSGSSSLKGEIIEFFGVPYLPSITATAGALLQPFTITKNYSQLKGYFQYYPSQDGADLWFTVIVNFTNNEGAVASGNKFIANETTGSWTEFAVELDYSSGNGGNATKASIQVTIGGDDNGVDVKDFYGTYFLVDDLSFDGTTSVGKIEGSIPTGFKLEQNYPNPFNPETKINFAVNEQSSVQLNIYNLLGEKVATLLNDNLNAGNYSANWNAQNIPSGTYIYQLISGK